MMITIDLAKDFSRTPFGRYTSDSLNSAEKFRTDWLLPAFKKQPSEKVMVDFSGISMGLGSSFLEEAFGGLVRQGVPAKLILDNLEIKSRLPIYTKQITEYVLAADKEVKA
ncbi:STAS-like domain-containing protein [Vibrio cyclitrophicus]